MGMVKSYSNNKKFAPPPPAPPQKSVNTELKALKCQGCGAPLAKNNQCEYCGTRHFVGQPPNGRGGSSQELERMRLLAGLPPKPAPPKSINIKE